MTIHLHNDIGTAMSNYNKLHGRYFITIDSFIVCAVLSDAYTTDQELAQLSMSSLSTVKRSINRLCSFGLLNKHISHTNQKTLTINEPQLRNFTHNYLHSDLESSVVHG